MQWCLTSACFVTQHKEGGGVPWFSVVSQGKRQIVKRPGLVSFLSPASCEHPASPYWSNCSGQITNPYCSQSDQMAVFIIVGRQKRKRKRDKFIANRSRSPIQRSQHYTDLVDLTINYLRYADSKLFASQGTNESPRATQAANKKCPHPCWSTRSLLHGIRYTVTLLHETEGNYRQTSGGITYLTDRTQDFTLWSTNGLSLRRKSRSTQLN